MRGPARIGIGFLAQASGVALGFVFTLLITGFFPPAAVGSYYVTLTLANVGAVLGAAGFGPAALQLMTGEDAKRRREAIGGLAILSSLVGGVLVGILAVLLEERGAVALVFQDLAPGSWRWAVIPAMAVALVVREVFRAEGLGHVPLIVEQLLKNVLKIAVVLTVALGFLAASPDLLYLSLLVGTVVSSVLGAGLVRRLVELRLDRDAMDIDLRRLAGIGAPLLVNGVLWLALGWTDTLMVGGMRGSEEAAYYSVALKVGTLGAMGLVAVSAVLPERFGRQWRQGDRAGAGEVLRESGFVAGSMAVSVAVTFAVLAREVLGVFGAPYVVAEGALRVLLVGQAFHALSGFAGIALNIVGGHRQVLAVNAVATTLNIVLNAVLIPIYGIAGAAGASTVSLLAMNGLQGYLLVRVWKTRWFASRPALLAAVGLVSGAGAFCVASLPLGSAASTVGAVAVAGTVTVAVYLWWERQ